MGHVNYRIIAFFDASSKPDCPTSHEIAQHDVHEQAVADDCNLTRMGDFRWILVEKVLDYLLMTTRLLQHQLVAKPMSKPLCHDAGRGF